MNDLLCLTQQIKHHQQLIQPTFNDEWEKDYV